jgi:tRNA A-37 threonylcarbamoyl transferase component Bud32
VIIAAVYGLLAVLLALRRFRHLLVYLVSLELLSALTNVMAGAARRPRPFVAPIRFGWAGFAFPSVQMAAVCAAAAGAAATLVPAGRWRPRAMWVAAALAAAIGLARIYLGADAPTDVLTGAVLGFAIPFVALRLFAPDDVFPITYRRGRSAHLDIGGRRGEAIRRAVKQQLGITVTEVQPFGMAGSGGSTPMRLRCGDQPDTYLFAKLYARSHLRADRWYKLGRELLYGRMEDERPFSGVRRLVEQEDYALRLMRDAGLPSPRPCGFAELTPEREYVLVTEFFDGATELGAAAVGDGAIDDGLAAIRRLWGAGLAHRDIKPANLLVRDGRLLLIDVAFTEVRPTPWRQAVDLANMMLCLALRSTPERVYQRAVREFTVDEIGEAFAAARGLALPSQLRHAIRASGRDLQNEFLRLLPHRPPPVRVQRWSARRIGLLAGVAAVTLAATASLPRLVISDDRSASVLAVAGVGCRSLEPLLVEAQSVPSASRVPCIRMLPVGWTFGTAEAGNGRSVIILNHDRAGPGALELTFTRRCAAATPKPQAVPVTWPQAWSWSGWTGAGVTWTRHEEFAGGCATITLRAPSRRIAAESGLPRQSLHVFGYVTRRALSQALERRSGGRLRLP